MVPATCSWCSNIYFCNLLYPPWPMVSPGLTLPSPASPVEQCFGNTHRHDDPLTILLCTVRLGVGHCTAALSCTVLHIGPLYCTAVYCTVLHWCVLHYTDVLQCTALWYTALHPTVREATLPEILTKVGYWPTIALQCTVVYYSILYCGVLHCTAL